MRLGQTDPEFESIIPLAEVTLRGTPPPLPLCLKGWFLGAPAKRFEQIGSSGGVAIEIAGPAGQRSERMHAEIAIVFTIPTIRILPYRIAPAWSLAAGCMWPRASGPPPGLKGL